MTQVNTLHNIACTRITRAMMADRFADTCWDEVEDREPANDSDTDTDEETQVFDGLVPYTSNVNDVSFCVAVLPMQVYVPTST